MGRADIGLYYTHQVLMREAGLWGKKIIPNSGPIDPKPDRSVGRRYMCVSKLLKSFERKFQCIFKLGSKGIKKGVQGCFMEVSTMFQQCFKGMSRKSHENFKGIMKSV